MTVRWKPLLILSGLFVVVALVGLMTIATVMGSRGSSDFVARARAERKAREFDKAKLDYQIALKSDNRNAALYEEFAEFCREWMTEAPAEKKADLRTAYLSALTSAANHGTRRAEPRRRLLDEAVRNDDHNEQVRWARSLAAIDPTNTDAAYVLAADDLEGTSPNLTEINGLLKVLRAEPQHQIRTEWIAARIAAVGNDKEALGKILDRVRATDLPANASSVDRMALLRLRGMDLAETSDVKALADRVAAVKRDAIATSNEPEIPSTRIARISILIEDVQRSLIARGIEHPDQRELLNTYGDSLDETAEAIFQKSLAVKGGADLNVYLAYADHLRFRDHRDLCLKVALQGLASPAAAKQGTTETGLGLHALTIEAYLANLKDPSRYEIAAPHIKSLLDCKVDRFQALGHLFQGAIDLEKAGLVNAPNAAEMNKVDQAALRSAALVHLRTAAGQLPHLAEAQARYGVALILNQEPSMGRQYLQRAQRLGTLEPQYQIWTAWSVVQAGYPEDAEPIVARMLQAVQEGRLPRSYEGTLHLLKGEIFQARKSPADLKKAVEEYTRAFANGEDATPAVELRLAQIEVMLGRPADALKRIDWLVSKGKAGPGAENLAILTLIEQKRDDEAQKRLAKARSAYPDSSELAIVEASMLLKAKRPEQADQVLADFLTVVPDNVPAVLQRAQILASNLNRPADARKLLASVAERAENSAPSVQLALLEMTGKDFSAAAETIRRIKLRWKDAATSDLLDAQLALSRNDVAGASNYYESALKKDPNNKLVQFYKAQLDGRTDPEGASKVFQSLAHDKSVKEIDSGFSLVAAAQSAIASMALESGDLDTAIARYREMLKDATNPAVIRSIRWQLVAAQAAKKEWPAARAEMISLLNDPKSPTTNEERIRAASYFRFNKEDAAALAQADEVLKSDPTYPGAVVTRAEILARTNKHADAISTIRRATESTKVAGKPVPAVLYLMLAAVESTAPPTDTGFARALTVLDQGLAEQPDAVELVQAKCRVLTITQGFKAGAAFISARAQSDPKGPWRQLLLTTYRDHNDFAAAEQVASDIVKADPADAGTAATQIQMIAAQVAEAIARSDRVEASRLDEKTAMLIDQDRTRFKNDPTFLQLDCELAIRRGDLTRAMSLTQEIDAKVKNSTVGPLLRAQIFMTKGQSQEAAAAYAEALSRNPRQPEARLQLARLSLLNGETEVAIREARFLQDADPDKPTALAAALIEARGIATLKGPINQVQANRAKALDRLAAIVHDRPTFAEASALMAEIQMMNGDRTKAVTTLKAALKANPNDSDALATVIQILAEPKTKGQAPAKTDLDDARALAKTYGDLDPKGDRSAAIAGGYSKANQPELALPWAEKAATTQNSVPAHLGLGDLLLTMSEAETDQSKARKLLDRALTEYDTILAVQPNLVEAVNNKAWILHSYLNRSQDALTLAQNLARRVDPSVLPGEFYDTLGSIQEQLGDKSEAEKSYQTGLNKSPEHPVLNFHMGQLLMADKSKSRRAGEYLKAAQAGSNRLPATLLDKLNLLLLQAPAN